MTSSASSSVFELKELEIYKCLLQEDFSGHKLSFFKFCTSLLNSKFHSRDHYHPLVNPFSVYQVSFELLISKRDS